MVITTKTLDDKSRCVQGIRLTQDCLLLAITHSYVQNYDSDFNEITRQLNELHIKFIY